MHTSGARLITEVIIMRNETIRKLQEMRLSAMAGAYMTQLEHPENFSNMTFDERFALIVDHESDVRLNNKLKRLIRNAHFPNSQADLADIQYLPDRHLDRGLIHLLSTNAYIEKSRDIILCGATGSGKTFLANALGMNACRAGYKALYLRPPDFFVEYALAAARNKQQDYTKKLQNVRLLILDEFLLVPVKPPQQESLLELLERRSGNTSTIYCSQYSFAGWHEQLGGGAIADSILDRIIHGSYKLEIKGDVSMRQRLAEAEKAEELNSV